MASRRCQMYSSRGSRHWMKSRASHFDSAWVLLSALNSTRGLNWSCFLLDLIDRNFKLFFDFWRGVPWICGGKFLRLIGLVWIFWIRGWKHFSYHQYCPYCKCQLLGMLDPCDRLSHLRIFSTNPLKLTETLLLHGYNPLMQSDWRLKPMSPVRGSEPIYIVEGLSTNITRYDSDDPIPFGCHIDSLNCRVERVTMSFLWFI